jgi:hypothetical protein
LTRSQAPKGMDMAVWLRLRAERRGQAGVVAGYVHELSDRHSSDGGSADGDVSNGHREAGRPAGGGS